MSQAAHYSRDIPHHLTVITYAAVSGLQGIPYLPGTTAVKNKQ